MQSKLKEYYLRLPASIFLKEPKGEFVHVIDIESYRLLENRHYDMLKEYEKLQERLKKYERD